MSDKPANPTVNEIKAKRRVVAFFLRMHGFDGLFNTAGECACKLGDLHPCGEDWSDCEAGYLVQCSEKLQDGPKGWHIGRERTFTCPDCKGEGGSMSSTEDGTEWSECFTCDEEGALTFEQVWALYAKERDVNWGHCGEAMELAGLKSEIATYRAELIRELKSAFSVEKNSVRGAPFYAPGDTCLGIMTPDGAVPLEEAPLPLLLSTLLSQVTP